MGFDWYTGTEEIVIQLTNDDLAGLKLTAEELALEEDALGINNYQVIFYKKDVLEEFVDEVNEQIKSDKNFGEVKSNLGKAIASLLAIKKKFGHKHRIEREKQTQIQTYFDDLIKELKKIRDALLNSKETIQNISLDDDGNLEITYKPVEEAVSEVAEIEPRSEYKTINSKPSEFAYKIYPETQVFLDAYANPDKDQKIADKLTEMRKPYKQFVELLGVDTSSVEKPFSESEFNNYVNKFKNTISTTFKKLQKAIEQNNTNEIKTLEKQLGNLSTGFDYLNSTIHFYYNPGNYGVLAREGIWKQAVEIADNPEDDNSVYLQCQHIALRQAKTQINTLQEIKDSFEGQLNQINLSIRQLNEGEHFLDIWHKLAPKDSLPDQQALLAVVNSYCDIPKGKIFEPLTTYINQGLYSDALYKTCQNQSDRSLKEYTDWLTQLSAKATDANFKKLIQVHLNNLDSERFKQDLRDYQREYLSKDTKPTKEQLAYKDYNDFLDEIEKTEAGKIFAKYAKVGFREFKTSFINLIPLINEEKTEGELKQYADPKVRNRRPASDEWFGKKIWNDAVNAVTDPKQWSINNIYLTRRYQYGIYNGIKGGVKNVANRLNIALDNNLDQNLLLHQIINNFPAEQKQKLKKELEQNFELPDQSRTTPFYNLDINFLNDRNLPSLKDENAKSRQTQVLTILDFLLDPNFRFDELKAKPKDKIETITIDLPDVIDPNSIGTPNREPECRRIRNSINDLTVNIAGQNCQMLEIYKSLASGEDYIINQHQTILVKDYTGRVYYKIDDIENNYDPKDLNSIKLELENFKRELENDLQSLENLIVRTQNYIIFSYNGTKYDLIANCNPETRYIQLGDKGFYLQDIDNIEISSIINPATNDLYTIPDLYKLPWKTAVNIRDFWSAVSLDLIGEDNVLKKRDQAIQEFESGRQELEEFTTWYDDNQADIDVYAEEKLFNIDTQFVLVNGLIKKQEPLTLAEFSEFSNKLRLLKSWKTDFEQESHQKQNTKQEIRDLCGSIEIRNLVHVRNVKLAICKLKLADCKLFLKYDKENLDKLTLTELEKFKSTLLDLKYLVGKYMSGVNFLLKKYVGFTSNLVSTDNNSLEGILNLILKNNINAGGSATEVNFKKNLYKIISNYLNNLNLKDLTNFITKPEENFETFLSYVVGLSVKSLSNFAHYKVNVDAVDLIYEIRKLIDDEEYDKLDYTSDTNLEDIIKIGEIVVSKLEKDKVEKQKLINRIDTFKNDLEIIDSKLAHNLKLIINKYEANFEQLAITYLRSQPNGDNKDLNTNIENILYTIIGDYVFKIKNDQSSNLFRDLIDSIPQDGESETETPRTLFVPMVETDLPANYSRVGEFLVTIINQQKEDQKVIKSALVDFSSVFGNVDISMETKPEYGANIYYINYENKNIPVDLTAVFENKNLDLIRQDIQDILTGVIVSYKLIDEELPIHALFGITESPSNQFYDNYGNLIKASVQIPENNSLDFALYYRNLGEAYNNCKKSLQVPVDHVRPATQPAQDISKFADQAIRTEPEIIDVIAVSMPGEETASSNRQNIGGRIAELNAATDQLVEQINAFAQSSINLNTILGPAFPTPTNTFSEVISDNTDQHEIQTLKTAAKQILDLEASTDWHAILNLQPNATTADIKRAYRRKADIFHPDKVQHLGDNELNDLCAKAFIAIANAKDILTRPEQIELGIKTATDPAPKRSSEMSAEELKQRLADIDPSSLQNLESRYNSELQTFKRNYPNVPEELFAMEQIAINPQMYDVVGLNKNLNFATYKKQFSLEYWRNILRLSEDKKTYIVTSLESNDKSYREVRSQYFDDNLPLNTSEFKDSLKFIAKSEHHIQLLLRLDIHSSMEQQGRQKVANWEKQQVEEQKRMLLANANDSIIKLFITDVHNFNTVKSSYNSNITSTDRDQKMFYTSLHFLITDGLLTHNLKSRLLASTSYNLNQLTILKRNILDSVKTIERQKGLVITEDVKQQLPATLIRLAQSSKLTILEEVVTKVTGVDYKILEPIVVPPLVAPVVPTTITPPDNKLTTNIPSQNVADTSGREEENAEFKWPSLVEVLEDRDKKFEVLLPEYEIRLFGLVKKGKTSPDFHIRPQLSGNKFNITRIDKNKIKLRGPFLTFTPDIFNINDLNRELQVSVTYDKFPMTYTIKLVGQKILFTLKEAKYEDKIYTQLVVADYLRKHPNTPKNSVFLPFKKMKVYKPKVLSNSLNAGQAGGGYSESNILLEKKFNKDFKIDKFLNEYVMFQNFDKEEKGKWDGYRKLQNGEIMSGAFPVIDNPDLKVLFIRQRIYDEFVRGGVREFKILCNTAQAQELLSKITILMAFKDDGTDTFSGHIPELEKAISEILDKES